MHLYDTIEHKLTDGDTAYVGYCAASYAIGLVTYGAVYCAQQGVPVEKSIVIAGLTGFSGCTMPIALVGMIFQISDGCGQFVAGVQRLSYRLFGKKEDIAAAFCSNARKTSRLLGVMALMAGTLWTVGQLVDEAAGSACLDHVKKENRFHLSVPSREPKKEKPKTGTYQPSRP